MTTPSAAILSLDPAKIPSTAVLWGLPSVFLLLMVAVGLFQANVWGFHLFNGISRYTGDSVWAHVTLLGEGLLALALIAPIARWRADIAWTLFLAALIGIGVVNGAKEIIDLPRPAAVLPGSELHIIGPRLTKVAFPSGHTTTIVAFSTIIALHIADRRLWAVLALAVALVGLSRVVVGAHWPQDVLAGVISGWFVAIVCIMLAQRWRTGFERPWQTVICIVSIMAAYLFWGAETGQGLALGFQRAASVFTGVLGLVTLIGLWWPLSPAGPPGD